MKLVPNWADFNLNWKNPRTLRLFHSTHHGSQGSKKASDFTKFHLACCLEFVDIKVAEETHRVRCMNVFIVDSDQGCVHRKLLYKNGPNKIYTYMKHNETATWGMVKDANPIKNHEEWQGGKQGCAATRVDSAAASD
ncbi:hypothetical protein N0V86_006967 [Didymella sp. IMI 355093]|nr:hypothetical protein N0V86_006967 [Didymella sp. IMI 355093]